MACLGLRPEVVEQAGDSSDTLFELLLLPYRVRYGLGIPCQPSCSTIDQSILGIDLQDLLVLLDVRFLHFLRRPDIVLQVGGDVLPSLEPLKEELRHLSRTVSQRTPERISVHNQGQPSKELYVGGVLVLYSFGHVEDRTVRVDRTTETSILQ